MDPELPDAKKLPVACLDGHHLEESPAPSSLLTELVSETGRSPDEVAWELQRADLGRELLLLSPLVGFFLVESLGLALSPAYFLFYLLGILPVLALRLVWGPLRYREETGVTQTLGDLAFLGAALVQSYWITFAGVGLVATVVANLLTGAGLPMRFVQPLLLLLTFGVGAPYLFNRVLAASLVEREMEAELLRELPGGHGEEVPEASNPLGTGALWLGRLRTTFRAGVLAFLGYLPVLGLQLLGMPLGDHPGAGLWMLTWSGLAGFQVFRGFFYAAMGERARYLLERPGRPSGAAVPALPPGSAPGEEGHGELVSSSGQGDPGDLAWARAREPAEITHAFGVSLGAGLASVGGLLALATLGAGKGVALALGSALALALVSPFLGRRYLATREPGRGGDELPALPTRGGLFLASLPAALVLAGVLLVFQAVSPAIWAFSQVPLLSLVFQFGLGVFLLEGVARTWAWGLARSLPAALRPARPRSLARLTQEGGTAWRRATVVGTGTWALGYSLVMAYATWIGPYNGDVAFLPCLFLPLAMGFQVLLRSHLHEQLAEEEGGESSQEALPPDTGG